MSMHLAKPPDANLFDRENTLQTALKQPTGGSAKRNGGARRSRTDDILLAKQALYQLSYGPVQG